MLKFIFLGLFCFLSLHADALSEAFKEAKVDGEIRAVGYARTADDSKIFSEAKGIALGGNLGISTKKINGFGANVRFYTTNPITTDDKLMQHTYLVDNSSGYTIIGEANIEYQNKNFDIKIGRQALKTPLVASDDARVIKDLFEAAKFTTTIIPKTTVNALYISRNSGMDNGASNYNPNVSQKDFVSMSKTLETSYDEGMYAIGITHNPTDNIMLNGWYYDGIKLVDMYFIEGSYSNKIGDSAYKIEAHYWKIKSKKEYNEDTNQKIDYYYAGARGSLIYKKFIFQYAQEHISYKQNTHGIHTAWGMYSEYTYGFLMGSGILGAINGYQNKYITKVDAYKLTGIYNYNSDIMFYMSYNIWRNNNTSLQADMNVFDLLISWPCYLLDNGKWQFIYENWNADENEQNKDVMVDNNLFRVKFTYNF